LIWFIEQIEFGNRFFLERWQQIFLIFIPSMFILVLDDIVRVFIYVSRMSWYSSLANSLLLLNVRVVSGRVPTIHIWQLIEMTIFIQFLIFPKLLISLEYVFLYIFHFRWRIQMYQGFPITLVLIVFVFCIFFYDSSIVSLVKGFEMRCGIFVERLEIGSFNYLYIFPKPWKIVLLSSFVHVPF